jgi:hypothetical protein
MRSHIASHILKEEISILENLCGYCGLICGNNVEIEKNGNLIKETLLNYN